MTAWWALAAVGVMADIINTLVVSLVLVDQGVLLILGQGD